MKLFSYFSMVICAGLMSATCHGDVYSGNGNSGFGGPIGNGSLELTQSGSVINGVLTIGPSSSLNDNLVLYIDSVAGGATSTATFTDEADGGRRAISGKASGGTNSSTVNFASGFGADYALSLTGGFAGVFNLSTPTNFGFVTDAGVAGPSPNFSFNFDLADIGLTEGDSFDFVGTYLNDGNAFRSDEAFGDGIAGGNPGNSEPASAVTFSNSLTFSTTAAVPEPSSLALLMLGAIGTCVRRRRNR